MLQTNFSFFEFYPGILPDVITKDILFYLVIGGGVIIILVAAYLIKKNINRKKTIIYKPEAEQIVRKALQEQITPDLPKIDVFLDNIQKDLKRKTRQDILKKIAEIDVVNKGLELNIDKMMKKRNLLENARKEYEYLIDGKD